MLALLLFAIAILGLIGGRFLRHTDEVLALAGYSVSALSGLWAFSTASSTIQVLMGVTAFTWLQVSSPRQ